MFVKVIPVLVVKVQSLHHHQVFDRWYHQWWMIASAGNFSGRKILRQAASAAPPDHKTFNYKSALFSWQIHKDFTSQQNCFLGHIGQSLGRHLYVTSPTAKYVPLHFFGSKYLDANLSKNKAHQMHHDQNARFDGCISFVPYLYLSRPDADIDIHFHATLYH